MNLNALTARLEVHEPGGAWVSPLVKYLPSVYITISGSWDGVPAQCVCGGVSAFPSPFAPPPARALSQINKQSL